MRPASAKANASSARLPVSASSATKPLLQITPASATTRHPGVVLYVRLACETEVLWHEVIVQAKFDTEGDGRDDCIVVNPALELHVLTAAVPPLTDLKIGDGVRLPEGLGVAYQQPVVPFAQRPHGTELADFIALAKGVVQREVEVDPARYPVRAAPGQTPAATGDNGVRAVQGYPVVPGPRQY